MATAVLLDKDAIARACEQYGVARLRVFGSVLTSDSTQLVAMSIS